jgi:hypothetical protein
METSHACGDQCQPSLSDDMFSSSRLEASSERCAKESAQARLDITRATEQLETIRKTGS